MKRSASRVRLLRLLNGIRSLLLGCIAVVLGTGIAWLAGWAFAAFVNASVPAPLPGRPASSYARGSDWGWTEETGYLRGEDVASPPPLTWHPVKADEAKQEAVRDAMRHAWTGYAASAWGADELLPVSKRPRDSALYGAMGATIVDSLDTLLLMGLKREFNAARAWVKDSLRFDADLNCSAFEVNIRVVGGLMSAYHLTGDRLFLDRAATLGERLMVVFDTAPPATGVPYNWVNFKKKAAYGLRHHDTVKGERRPAAAVLSEFGTFQLELGALAEATKRPRYATAAARAVTSILRKRPCVGCPHGLYPWLFTPDDGSPANKYVTISGLGDSFYEYLLKAWLQSRGDSSYAYLLQLWQESMDGMLVHLLLKSPASGTAYVAELREGKLVHRFGHLACFIPGMLALGAPYASTGRAGSLQGQHPQAAYMVAAEDLMTTCWRMYESTATGLSPETVEFRFSWAGNADMVTEPGSAYNILRPETAESLLLLYRRTGNETYRAWGWRLFQAFEAHCRVPGGGFSGLRNVHGLPPRWDDVQQSFFLAETLKYLFLLFSGAETVPLDAYVMTTEAHPLKLMAKPPPLPPFDLRGRPP